MQNRRAIQKFLLLLNQPHRWARIHAGSDATAAWKAQALAGFHRGAIDQSSNLPTRTVTPDEYQMDHENDPDFDPIAMSSREITQWVSHINRQIQRGRHLRTQVQGLIQKAKGMPRTIKMGDLSVFEREHVLPLLVAVDKVWRRLEICDVPGCNRVFVRALSKPAQKDCPRCRRRWSPKERWSARTQGQTGSP